ncbi:LysR substrate-binding domain-containing protein [Pectobacteriaceae bacterium C52]|nr:LysR substrate-binding domain-containing protein [Pectobacteriaceae bacterium C52]
MRRKIPNTSALMAFEAAARHGSFARAAGELALTEGAISRQIARLEDFLACKLFDRAGNRVSLSSNGARYALQVREILERLDRDSQYLRGLPSSSASLEIAVIPTFASRWLIPRLGRFQDKHPGITLHLAERTEPFVLPGSGFDAAVHFEHPAWAGMSIFRLFQEVLVPVCHPTLLTGKDINVLLNTLPRIHRRQNPDAWENYAYETGIVLETPSAGVRYDLHTMSIASALAGLGVALVPRIYIEAEIHEGKLVAPWPEAKTVTKNFCLVLPGTAAQNEGALTAFREWLLEEARN